MRREVKPLILAFALDGPGESLPFEIGNNDFRYSVLQTNAVIRCEFSPGSILFLVWQHDQESYLSGTEADINQSLRRSVEALNDSKGFSTFMFKLNYRFGS